MQEALTPPDPPLQGGGIALRPFRTSDAPTLALATLDPEIVRFTFMPERMSEQRAKEWIERSQARWAMGGARLAIADAEVHEHLLGMVGIAVHPTLGSGEAFYWVLPGRRGRGVASTALGLLANWAFDVVGVERLYLLISPDYAPSAAVARRCGFHQEGTLRAYQPFKGARPDVVSWSLLPADPRPVRGQKGHPDHRGGPEGPAGDPWVPGGRRLSRPARGW